MHEIFATLGYAKEKALLDDSMSTWGYEATKNMVKKCEEKLIHRFGSVNENDAFKFKLEEIYELYALIDDGTPNVSADFRDRIHHYLLECLFYKLEELNELCIEIDL